MEPINPVTKNYWIYVRVFHILLGFLLAYVGVRHFQGKKTPQSFYYLITIFGSGAVLYHGYRLAQAYGYIN